VSRLAAFEIQAREGLARRGRLYLAHGTVETPAFMPVGTRGAVKGVTLDAVRDLGAEIILANTYHLHLRPGDELIADLGGLHTFLGWSRPILTDSGGYQVFSLAARRQLSEDGVVFRSHLDGRALSLTPESATDIQARLGADVAMMLDECPSWPASHDETEAAMSRTLRWAGRGRARYLALRAGQGPDVARPTPDQAQFGIVQGGTFKDLRDRSVAGTLAVGFEAYARRRHVRHRRAHRGAIAGGGAALPHGRRDAGGPD
jgi:queuine tRNA-ribosyltransferase